MSAESLERTQQRNSANSMGYTERLQLTASSASDGTRLEQKYGECQHVHEANVSSEVVVNGMV